jgi:excisionase family DNA binding protein
MMPHKDNNSSRPGRETAALFVRLPAAEAEKLDRAAFELRAPKQDLVTGLVARYVDPGSPESLAELGALGRARQGTRRVTVETQEDSLTVGRHSFRPADPPEVLTLAQLAALLETDEATAEAMAEQRRLPGRKIGEEWRFSRRAVLDWLAGGEPDRSAPDSD